MLVKKNKTLKKHFIYYFEKEESFFSLKTALNHGIILTNIIGNLIDLEKLSFFLNVVLFSFPFFSLIIIIFGF